MSKSHLYEASTGRWFFDDGNKKELLFTGYAGHPPHVNDVLAQSVKGGPLPNGIYRIEPQGDHVTGAGKTLFAALRLTKVNVKSERDGFFLHGEGAADSAKPDIHDHGASEGCIVTPKPNRDHVEKIRAQGWNELEVR